MTLRFWGAAALALPLLTVGCGPGAADIVQALANDHNSDCIKIVAIGVTTEISRNWGCLAPAIVPPTVPRAAP